MADWSLLSDCQGGHILDDFAWDLNQCFSGRATGEGIKKRDKESDYFQGVLRLSM